MLQHEAFDRVDTVHSSQAVVADTVPEKATLVNSTSVNSNIFQPVPWKQKTHSPRSISIPLQFPELWKLHKSSCTHQHTTLHHCPVAEEQNFQIDSLSLVGFDRIPHKRVDRWRFPGAGRHRYHTLPRRPGVSPTIRKPYPALGAFLGTGDLGTSSSEVGFGSHIDIAADGPDNKYVVSQNRARLNRPINNVPRSLLGYSSVVEPGLSAEDETEHPDGFCMCPSAS